MQSRKYKDIEVDRLRLDPENPRLPESLQGQQNDRDILEWMLQEATLLDLMASIAENKFFEGEPILVYKDGDNYPVIEGNRRLAALKLLSDPTLVPRYANSLNSLAAIASKNNAVPTTIMAYVCDSREEVSNYLGFRHVSGVKDWPTVSKARHVHLLYSKKIKEGKLSKIEIFKAIAREIGSKSHAVRRFMYGYELFKQIERAHFYNIKDLGEEGFDFSYITDAAFKYPELSKYLGVDANADDPLIALNPKRLEEVTHWLYEKVEGTGKTRVGETRNMRILENVLRNEQAKEAFIYQNSSLSEAAQFTTFADETFQALLSKANKLVQQAYNTANQVKDPQRTDFDLLNGIRETTDDIDLILQKKKRAAERESRLNLESL